VRDNRPGSSSELTLVDWGIYATRLASTDGRDPGSGDHGSDSIGEHAGANGQPVDDTYVDHSICGFGITVHVVGSYTTTDYYDNTGFRYKTIATVGPGPFRITATAKAPP
jgi:hypothetical protein